MRRIRKDAELRGRLWGALAVAVLLPLSPGCQTTPAESDRPQDGREEPGELERAIRDGLDWLQRTQQEDGSWDAISHNPWHGRFGVPGFCPLADRGIDPAVTALAFLTLLDAGALEEDSPYSGTARRALAYLVEVALGWVERVDSPRTYGCICHGGHSIAGIYNPPLVFLAIMRAIEVEPTEELRRIGETGLLFMYRTRDPDTEYSLFLPLLDSGCSIFVLQALFSARKSGIPAPQGLEEEANAYWRALIEPGSGRVLHSDLNPVCLGGWEAISMSLLFQKAFVEGDTELASKQRDIIRQHPPRWDENWLLPTRDEPPPNELFVLEKDIVNFFYWYFGTLALKPVGGEVWDDWRQALVRALLQNQCREGKNRGSWPPEDPWGRIGGRLYATTFSLRSLLEAR